MPASTTLSWIQLDSFECCRWDGDRSTCSGWPGSQMRPHILLTIPWKRQQAGWDLCRRSVEGELWRVREERCTPNATSSSVSEEPGVCQLGRITQISHQNSTTVLTWLSQHPHLPYGLNYHRIHLHLLTFWSVKKWKQKTSGLFMTSTVLCWWILPHRLSHKYN